MRISKTEIENYIPQRAPFIMIDNLVEVTAETFTTDFRILPGNIFVEKGVLREFALIENIAQSSSAGLAILKMSSGKKTTDGFIGGISKLILYDLPCVNETIDTIVRLIAQIENMFLVKGENYVNGRKLLECELKLAGI
jgi:predicted hotdog family 3-hydroxylacyl-ACP dehydratase